MPGSMACSAERSQQRRQVWWRGSFCGLLWLSFLAARVAHGHDPGRGPPTDTGPPETRIGLPPATADPDDQTAKAPQGDNWHHNLIRERPVEVRLRTARKEFQAGRTTEALSLLQAILDRDDDLFVRLEEQAVPTGAHLLAEQLLGSLPGDALVVYETLYGSEAHRLLREARKNCDIEQLSHVARRFFYTAAGFQAAVFYAHERLDHGAPAAAADCWRRLLNEPRHRPRLTNGHRLAAAACLARAGRAVEAHAALAELAPGTLVVGGRPIAIEEAAGWTAPTPESGVGLVATVARSTDADAPGLGSIPVLAQPRWTVALTGPETGHIAELALEWEEFQLQNGLPVGAAHRPLVVGQTAIFRDFEGIRAVDLRNGSTQWFYPTAWTLAADIPARESAPSDGNPDPNNSMRFLVGNCLLGTLAADSARVYAVDQLECEPPAAIDAEPPGDSSGGPRRSCNRLLALPLDARGGDVRPQWTLGGELPQETDRPAASPALLAGHFFIGPPLPLGDRLYVVSEYRQQLYLSCHRADTGALSWMQAISSVPQPLANDHLRWALVCTPSYAEGVLVCPTQAGVLTAVDPLNGRLLWAASHDEHEQQHRQHMSAWPYGARRRCGHPGYTNLPVVHSGRVVYLPAHGEFIQCLDLQSGKALWRARREDLDLSSASEYVASVDRGVVTIVGRRQCRGLDLQTGALRYRVRLKSCPSGTGARLCGAYIVPLDDGTVVCFDTLTGRPRGLSRSSTRTLLGNLLVADDVVLSMGRAELTAWPQADVELARLDGELLNDRRPETALAAAEVALALDKPREAQRRLDLLPRNLAGPLADRARTIAREALLVELAAGNSSHETLLPRLATLVQTPEEQGRYLVERALFEMTLGRHEALDATARELARLNGSGTLSLSNDPARRVHPADFVAALVTKAGMHTARVIDFPGNGHPAAASRPDFEQLDPARRLLAARKFHAAELCLLEARRSAQPQTAAGATRLLLELCRSRNLVHPAAQLLDELQTRYSQVEIEPGLTGAQYVANFPHDGSVWAAYRRPTAPAWSSGAIRISESPRENERLLALYNGQHNVQSPLVPQSVGFDLVDKGRPGAATQLVVVDRHTGSEFPESIQLPGRISPLATSQVEFVQHSYVGHFLPVGAAGAVHGVSLLERSVVWSAAIAELEGAKDPVRIGPAGPRFVACQYRQHLVVLDPASGRLKWRRDDLEPMSGLMTDLPHGIIGDERVLVVFSGSGGHYTVYDTATGEELRRSRLDIQMRLARRSFGRLLFHYSGNDHKQARVWDPLGDQFVWTEPADGIAEASLPDGAHPGAKLLSFVRETSEAAYVTRNGRLCVVDLPTGSLRFEVPLSREQLDCLCFVRAFRDGARYYFNLHRTPPAGSRQPGGCDIIRDAAPLYMVHLHGQGELLAVDSVSHQVLWNRSLGTRSIVHLPTYRLPVLVALFRVRNGEQPPLLGLEVLDASSGETLAMRSDLVSDHLLQVACEAAPASITLRGAKTSICVQLGADLARLDAASGR